MIVATRDDQLRPEITRGWGPLLADDEASLELCVAAAPASRTRANLDRGGVMAATFSVPTTYRTVQLKGAVLAVGEPRADQLARVDAHLAGFGEQVVADRHSRPRAARGFREPSCSR